MMLNIHGNPIPRITRLEALHRVSLWRQSVTCLNCDCSNMHRGWPCPLCGFCHKGAHEHAKPKPIAPKPQIRVAAIYSSQSQPGLEYEVRCYPDNTVTGCTCPSWLYRKTCRHVDHFRIHHPVKRK